MRAQADESRAELELRLAALEGEIVALRARESASSRILQAIAAGPEQAVRALDMIAESAATLCGAYDAMIRLRDGSDLVRGGHHGPIPMEAERLPISPRWTAGRCVLERRPIHVHDLSAAGDEYPEGAAMARRLGHRTILSVPLLRAGEAIGAILLRRFEVNPFSGDDIALLATFADQAVIAVGNTTLFQELQRRNAEVTEALEQQTAASEILRVISNSPADAQPVFDTIAESATRLCDAQHCFVFRFDGELAHLVAHHGVSDKGAEAARRSFPMPPGRGSAVSRALLSGRVENIPDVFLDPDYALGEVARQAGFRSTIAVPMSRGGRPVGGIGVTGSRAWHFSERHVDLLKTFAEQAVIAIENARLFGELREALQQQTAMADVLKAISRSTFDLPGVLSTLIEAAVRLCEADQGTIARERDGAFERVVSHGFSPEFMAAVLGKPVVLDRRSATGRALIDRHVVHVPDVQRDPDYDFPEALEHGGFRTLISVPMLRDGAPIGVLTISRKKMRPFAEKQIELLASFADQAAIAIENARLFTELESRNHALGEALEQQTATSAILRAIASSPTDLEPVLRAVAENAARLCGAADAQIFRVQDDMLRLEASFGSIPIYFREQKIGRGWVTGRAVVDRRTIHVHDLAAESEDEFPVGRRMQRRHGHRTTLATPLLKQGIVLGAILIRRIEVQPFSDDQIRLLETFADQAAIAIENARLFEALQARTGELQEALDYQTATSEVLGVISRSAFDLERVFEAIGESALRLCGAGRAFIFRYDGEVLRAVVGLNASPELAMYVESHPIRPGRHSATARAALERRTVHIRDVAADPEYTYGARDIDPLHTAVSVPILRGDALLGVINIYKLEVEAFTPKQIALLETFADQAAIAIENARLFEDLRAALAEFHAVLDNIDYGVLFMDKDLRARIVNPAMRRLWDIPQELIDQRTTMRELLEYNRDRGVYTTPAEEWDEWVARRIERVEQGDVSPGEFARADGKVYSYQCVALPDGGRMLSYFDITELKNRQAELLAAKEAAETALAELRTAQERLVQTEKLASLGQLTAGIAHEIKNPLNFVNNFAALSGDLLAELEAVLQAPIAALDAAGRDDAGDLFQTVRENLDKIVHHGRRADSIVKNMLLHARQGSGEWREADVNAIAEEALNLAYHGARAGHPDFNVEIVKLLDPEAGTIECCPQDVMRVVLNLVSNGIYAANRKRPSAPAGFVPRIELTTRAEDDGIAIEVRDNGTGIPAEIRDRIFLPFFTTKPAGEGTGLGLSLSHDIVKQHGGSFSVESEPEAFTVFRIALPRRAAAERRFEA